MPLYFAMIKTYLLSIENRERLFQKLFWVSITMALIVMPIMSFSFGITWDEWMQSRYGRLILKFFASGGTEQRALNYYDTFWYGGFFEIISNTIYGLASGNIGSFIKLDTFADPTIPKLYETRHFINALFGFLAILYTGLLAKQISKSWRAAFLAVLFIFLSPRFLGHSMNNPKDIPYATGYIMSLFYICRFLDESPRPKKWTIAGLIIGIAMAIGTRIGGIVLPFYLWLFAAVEWFNRKPKINLPPLLARLSFVSLAGYFGGLLFWPFGLVSPIKNPLLALKNFSHFIPLFSPEATEAVTQTDITPWYYIPKWIGITSPFFILAGICFLVFLLPMLFKNDNRKRFFLILLSIALPVISLVLLRSKLYDEWRHFLFIYPSLVILTALAWNQMFEIARNRAFKIVLTTILALLLVEPLAWIVRNHPNEYTYFNQTVGGLKGAYGRYDTDYWGNCLKAAAECVATDYKHSGLARRAIVEADGNPLSSSYYLKKALGNNVVDPATLLETNMRLESDYFIMMTRYRKPEDFLKENWPSNDAICKVKADGVTLCAALKNPKLSRGF
jgi:hypothetical protein